MEEEKYPIIEISGVRATLTPDGWACDDPAMKQMLEIDYRLYKSPVYQPYPLNAEAEAEAGRWRGAKVIYLMPVSEAPPNGLVY